MISVDLNVDAGETADGDQAVAAASSVNIACGGHAGDRATMEQTVRLAIAAGCAVGAHPSYPDREGFGRIRINISLDDLYDSIQAQIDALNAVVRAQGAALSHVKPHGALYHAMNEDPGTIEVMIKAAGRLPIVAAAGSPSEDELRRKGVHVIREGFADRRYRSDGRLVERAHPEALIDTPEDAAKQAVLLATEHEAVSTDGHRVKVECDTICLHTDQHDAMVRVRAVRESLEEQGVIIAVPSCSNEGRQ
ncbi:MAG: 5-oxoprolinase subunit PxpA [Planctomycetota bacterium]